MSGIVAQNLGRRSGLVKAASGGGGNWVEIKTLTSDGSDATMSFVDGTSDVVLDSTYPIYCFHLIDIHPETNDKYIHFQCNGAGETGYNETMTTSFWRAYGGESSGGGVAYQTALDQAQGTSTQGISRGILNDADTTGAGYLYLIGPSSTAHVTHFLSTTVINHGDGPQHTYVAGYINTAAAIDEVQFTMSSGEIQGGKIKLFGIKDS